MTMPVPPVPAGPATPAPSAPADPATPPAPAAPAVPPAATPPTPAAPKWDGDFDPERAARLVENLRAEVAGLKTQNTEAQAKLTQYETAQLTEAEKLSQRAATAEAELAKTRREVAVRDALEANGLPKDAARFLTGETAEEIAESAKAFAALAPAKSAEPADPPIPPTLPVPGHGSDPVGAGAQVDPSALAGMSDAEIMAAYREGRISGIRK